MSQNQTINTTLISLLVLLGASVQTAFTTNFWYGIADVVLVIALAVTYELLP